MTATPSPASTPAPAPDAPSQSPPQSPLPSPPPVRAASLAELPEEGAVRVELAGRPVCLARTGGEVFAIGDLCSHADVSLSEGDIEDGAIECWLHGSAFDLRTGQPTSLPAVRPVPTYPVTIEGDDVLVQMEPA